MDAFAAVMTGRGVGAIATVCVFGPDSEKIIKAVFRPFGKESLFQAGEMLLGSIIDDDQKTIDQVVLGCEQENNFAIHCHGNPLIVEMIMEALVSKGAKPVSAEQLIANQAAAEDSIALEIKLAQLKVSTMDGYKLLQNQIHNGLSSILIKWKTEQLRKIKQECGEILKTSAAANLLIHGCKVVIAGPANSGKSTLLNCLAGRQKSIVADIPGTTRDWISTTCTSGPLAMEIFDTAGLNEAIIENAIDKTAQQKSVELLKNADVIIWVLDGTGENADLNFPISNFRNVIVAVNKSDLGIKADIKNGIQISAKNGMGIERLLKKIRLILGLEDFDLKKAVCFTDRQKKLLEKISNSENISEAHSVITELLNGPVRV